MAAASSSSFSSTIPTSQAVNIHHLISVKLDHHYYLLWRTQFMPLLKPYDLEGYVDGSLLCPPHTLPSDKGDHDSLTLIPAYLAGCFHLFPRQHLLMSLVCPLLGQFGCSKKSVRHTVSHTAHANSAISPNNAQGQHIHG